MNKDKKVKRSNELNRILDSKLINTVFQPIISLKDGSILGYEALSRGPENSILFSPDKLFNAAERFNKLWDLEMLCSTKAIEKAAKMDKDKLLFINVSPMIINDSKFNKGFSKMLLMKNKISSETVVFEITERTSIKDYKSFRDILNNYIDHGYKIAIDDVGSGYSGLKTIAGTKPNYIKIDMDIIRDIDKDSFKQAIIKNFVSLAQNTNFKIIAEGIETEAELNTLIKLGVYAGQGFFLQKPKDTFLDITEEIREKIINLNKSLNSYYELKTHYIGHIVKKELAFNLKTLCSAIKNYFVESTATGTCIVDDENYPVGLVMEHTLNSMLATQYGNAIFSKRAVSLVMDNQALIVDYYTPIDKVSKAAMARNNEKIYDYVIVIKESKYCGIVTIKNLLEYTTILEKNYAKELNPLTGLPGNIIIDRVLNDTISYGREFCVLYFDLNNFKVYNDTYGFENGDKVIKFTASCIQNQINSSTTYNGFVGHVGGDDFVCVVETCYENCIDICEDFISIFDKEIMNFFSEEDKGKGYVVASDRNGNKNIFGLTSIAIAGVYGDFNCFANSSEISKFVADIKKEVKREKKSHYIIKNIAVSCE